LRAVAAGGKRGVVVSTGGMGSAVIGGDFGARCVN